MGLFDWLFGRTAARTAPAAPEALRERLIDVVHSGDDAALARLCAEHEAMTPGGNLVAAAMARVMLHSGTGQRHVH